MGARTAYHMKKTEVYVLKKLSWVSISCLVLLTSCTSIQATHSDPAPEDSVATQSALASKINKETANIVFIRHAQTIANVTHEYSTYTESTFSDAGKKQVQDLAGKLRGVDFDAIFVSPTWRTQNTILPYLKTQPGRMAEIWPELTECCWQEHTDKPTYAIDDPNVVLPLTKSIELEDKDHFAFRDKDSTLEYNWPDKNYADGMLQIQKAYQLITDRVADGDKTILVVCHYLAGTRLLDLLQGNEPTGETYIENAEPWLLQARPDGVFVRIP